ncbi:hypothetical protein F1847_05945 [Thermodesulfobacterium sp. TA1]|uniref:hypothetical protein n=1 Tax=Thermodesulfobacterium sp. TA1 TaxID=2234087 RepID=UPI0012327748|nr:hypothetical protein [Thermodesulfobacterium sp. TA1]QER42305.1 hypothetical protein F1847_05945 [Thermodesulfobacterium sp. TA1]
MKKKFKRGILGVCLFFLLTPINLKAENINLGVSISENRIDHFFLAVGDYFQVPKETIIILKKKASTIREEEIPLVLYISKKRRVSPDFIIDLRNRGYSWYDIFIYFGIKPEIEFKKIIVIHEPTYGPPYGKAWGYHKKHTKHKIIFSDHDLIVLANAYFMADYYKIEPIGLKPEFDKHPDLIILHEKLFTKHHPKK